MAKGNFTIRGYSFLLNHYLHKKKIEPKKIQQYPTGYMWNLSRGKTKI